MNIALWLRPLGEAKTPKEQASHVRSRLSLLVGSADGQLEALAVKGASDGSGGPWL
ncbi:hypothetical protein NicSoilB11_29990 [Arthrobacter sp. NicSoilB11]|nr:hypothetical protein StoSoilB19_29440 [Arthrobacter sp. StoSoilB19]BCW76674.1 hypothetical protein NicSoilB11_29990 [Arthrobacter sp. NicSoilB11]